MNTDCATHASQAVEATERTGFGGFSATEQGHNPLLGIGTELVQLWPDMVDVILGSTVTHLHPDTRGGARDRTAAGAEFAGPCSAATSPLLTRFGSGTVYAAQVARLP
ncbi:hypothetical protein QFZ82_007931 [Streptomyces sp. V4I23]|nr:hypothetical protein [Streptomyces sp. V4I23]MDQ1006001.1 hypothetical protein [Streptomyces sp. V4I23]MDQ1013363.1 hypothetical protein [Streptomyces sp. V4I23]